MTIKYTATALAAAATLAFTSCETMANANRIDANKINQASRVFPATVVSATNVTINTTSTAKNLGTGLGAALGAGAGSLLGSGSGQVVSTVGFGVAGALAGRYLTDSMGNTKGQTLTVRVDGSNQLMSVTQPVYKQYGYIPVGAHGMLNYGGESRFVPDAY